MPQRRRRSGIIIGLVALSLLAGVALTAGPAQAFVSGHGPLYPEPAWDQKKGAGRFLVLTNWNSEAVLDKETGLVWEKTPSIANITWIAARGHCTHDTTTGNRTGWRLPSIHELTSLLDTTVASSPTLPPGHPFATGATGVQPVIYWSATTNAGDPTRAWDVGFGDGDSFHNVKTSNGLYAWCVRGGMNADTY